MFHWYRRKIQDYDPGRSQAGKEKKWKNKLA
jgi:hypothetical protein